MSNLMKLPVLVALLITVQSSIATVDINKLTENVSTKIQILADTAASSIHQLTDSIDFEKLKEYDYLHILPKIKYGRRLIEAKQKKILALIPPTQKETLKYYGQTLRSLQAKDLLLAFELP